MTKTHYIETTEKFNENGKLVERVTREEWTDDDTVYDYAHRLSDLSDYCSSLTTKATNCTTEVKC